MRPRSRCEPARCRCQVCFDLRAIAIATSSAPTETALVSRGTKTLVRVTLVSSHAADKFIEAQRVHTTVRFDRRS